MYSISAESLVIKPEILSFLRQKGESTLAKYLETSDFFTAPASTVFHGNYEGGLSLHSYHVAKIAEKLAHDFGLVSPVEGYTAEEFAFFLGVVHDLCKVNFYESFLKNVKNDRGEWVKESAYKVKNDHKSYGHGFTSYLRMTKLADNQNLVTAATYPVLYHMGSYDVSESATKGYAKAQSDFPWLTILQSADSMAAFVYGY